MTMDMPGMVMPWSVSDIILLFVMWAVMMVAMMTPSAAPMVFGFLTINRRRRVESRSLLPVGIFLLGYVAVWTGFSAGATAAQWGLHKAAALSAAMVITNPLLNGCLLIAAGIFQWTPLKRTCLQSCRTPISFLMSRWRNGDAGAFIMGVEHGAYCLGCCWLLMALLFVAGVMNLLWIVLIALFVVAEKTFPRGELLARGAGVVLIAAGVAVSGKI